MDLSSPPENKVPVLQAAVLPTYADVVAAAARLQGVAHRTPVATSATANALAGAEVFFKCENFQRIGAFKFRGAFNALANLPAPHAKAGVVCFSSGNHAQAVTLAGHMLGIATVVLMPQDAPPSKIEATRGYLRGNTAQGSEVILYNRFADDREAMMHQLARERGLTMVPPFDHADVVAGQGTAGMELFEETGPLDALFVCLGGGGLLAGCALAAQALSPGCKVYGVEPAAGNDAQQSMAAGRIVRIGTPKTIADGAQTQSVGVLNFALMQKLVAGVHTVTDAELVSAMRFFAERMKMVVEPTGALGWAAALKVRASLVGQRVGVIVSGGNVDMGTFSRLLAQAG